MIPLPSTDKHVLQNNRRHDLDALRAAAMLLGIAYHAALSFAIAFPWLVQDVSQNKAFFIFQASTHGFRMQLFFLISGFFTAMLWRKRGLKSVLWQRFQRILLPCLMGLLTVVPAMKFASMKAIESGLTKQAKQDSPKEPELDIWTVAATGDTNVIVQYLSKGININKQNSKSGITPLTTACLYASPATIEFLLQQGAFVNGRNQDGGTALHAAAFLGRSDIVDILLRAGADITAVNSRGETVLNSASADWQITQYIAGLLQLKLNQSEVESGRKRCVELINQAAAKGGLVVNFPRDQQDRSIKTSAWFGFIQWLLYNPVFILIWFLWFLWWLVVCFAVYAWIAERSRWHLLNHKYLLSPVTLLILIALTMIPQSFMGSSNGGFGPDISMGIIPLPYIFIYYALFFGFGVLYYDCGDYEGRLGQHWRFILPSSLLIVFPLALEFATGIFGFRESLLSKEYHRIATVGLQALYAWLMTFGCIGLFRSSLTRENKTIRYLSDSSYWLYLAHLPLIILMQLFVRDWPWPAALKFGGICVVITALLLASYELFVRYTWLGTFLNGPRKRTSVNLPNRV